MVFKRVWDSTCPLVWHQWESDGIIWTIQDLPPEDDDHAIQLLLEQFLPDERLCSILGIHEDPDSTQKIEHFWRKTISQRMSLACYKTVENNKVLAALNVCTVKCIDAEEESTEEEMEPGKFCDLLKTLKYLESKCNTFENLNVTQYLYGLGLLVTRENRGFKLGAKVLSARVPMCQKLGLTATSTLFTGTASQKLAAKCGYRTDLEVTLDELAQNGMQYLSQRRPAVCQNYVQKIHVLITLHSSQ